MWQDGSKYVGSWKDGMMNDQGEYFFPDGKHYKGSFKDDMRHGFGTYTLPNGSKYAGLWEDGKQHGKGKFTNQQGQFCEGVWYQGVIVTSFKPESKIVDLKKKVNFIGSINSSIKTEKLSSISEKSHDKEE